VKTSHRVHIRDSRDMGFLPAASVDLVLTSPPYPMIGMWDETFAALSPAVKAALERSDGRGAFEAMHRALEPVWRESCRVLKPGGLACINIGDATRTIGDDFMLYPNHARILARLMELGLTPLPAILWRKQTNAPNKFMGSGMLPAGAYVTLEHEYILVLRKGAKREFQTGAEKKRRRESAIFWEERNDWFSDVWTALKGARQRMAHANDRRSGAFPFELAYRLINMFSIQEDVVLDPFLGTGTTARAAAAAGRNSIGCEIEPDRCGTVFKDPSGLVRSGRQRVRERIAQHTRFVDQCRATGRELKHTHRIYGFPVVTRQETELLLAVPERAFAVESDHLQVAYARDPTCVEDAPATRSTQLPSGADRQLQMF
jgi:modification methylase